MVVCKCRKATKLYCFVHKVPVCGECICFPEHQICVIRTYSEWVIDGDYDWPPTCCLCQTVLEDKSDSQTTRLGCLHVIHTNCLVSHIKSYPQNTAPAGYACPACSTSIWPPKSVKDSGSRLHSKLKEAIMQTGLEKNLFGNYPVSLPTSEPNGPPPAFASDPLVHVSTSGVREKSNAEISATDIVEIDGPNSRRNQLISEHGPNFVPSPAPPGATTRKTAYPVERQNSEISYYADDEDGNQKKYTRRGPFRHKFLRALLPFWSSAMPTLPVTAPRKEASHMDDVSESRSRHQRSSRMDPRKILLILAIMACMATMGILYYRLAQRGLGESQSNDEQR
ncbi:hypothetical protein AQUCO_04200161v1 [Aquilegia coerulea]|uniref:RING-type domain-containing protein n=1 Tax=Aquilegia coerulea TaxID=218851 RepID=A0A2G5CPJ9_AQUCA|nr:hypothetical protein AQUCO_04200161v1 [Aquilegia coerulea]